MTTIDHYQLSRILGSQILGNVPVFHGQLGTRAVLDSVEAYSAEVLCEEVDQDIHSKIDSDAVYRVFIELRKRRSDCGSPDLYIADKVRNDELVIAWRENGVKGSIRQLNRCLMNGRKASKLKELNSVRFEIDRDVKERIRFACEFSACELRYERGATIDDILCCPILADEFHKRCRRAAPNSSWLDFRWTILSLRKAGRHNAQASLNTNFENAPVILHGMIEPKQISLQSIGIPNTAGVFALAEGKKELYISGARDLRSSIEYLSQPEFQKMAQTALWKPSTNLFFSYAEVDKEHVAQVETWLIAKKCPLFNVSRTAS